MFNVIANVMATGAATQYMNSFGMIQPVPYYSLWLVGLTAHIQFLVSFFASGLAVPLIWYTYNKDFVRVLLLAPFIFTQK